MTSVCSGASSLAAILSYTSQRVSRLTDNMNSTQTHFVLSHPLLLFLQRQFHFLLMFIDDSCINRFTSSFCFFAEISASDCAARLVAVAGIAVLPCMPNSRGALLSTLADVSKATVLDASHQQFSPSSSTGLIIKIHQLSNYPPQLQKHLFTHSSTHPHI